MQIKASVNNIRFRNDNGWSVVDFVDETNLRFVGVGVMPSAYEGEQLELNGEWTMHKTYGRQFNVKEYSSVAPSSLDGIFKYISSGLIKGIGEPTARAIIDKFGENTLEIIAKQPEKLKLVSGIGAVRSQMIHNSYMEKAGLQEVIMGLQTYGITINQAVKIHKLYGDGCVEKVRDNPYRLIEDVDSIGFKTADKIAYNTGIEADSPFRIKAGILHTLNMARNDGNTCIPRDVLIMKAANNILGIDISPVEVELERMIMSSQLVEKHIDGEDFVFLSYLHYQEMDCAVRLMKIKRGAEVLPMFDIDGEIDALQKRLGIELALTQRKAVTLALTEGVMVITGGPGTGKTTILTFIIELMEAMGLSIELAAPTGRAAKRISDTTGREARTIHRLLEYGFGADEFSRNDDYPIEADAIIIDEMSMVDVALFHSLLKAVSEGTRLVMVGDFDQLPPVGAGNVLRDIVTTDAVPIVRLSEIFRQAGRSMIVTNAHRINRGMMPVLNSEESDFVFIRRNSLTETLDTVIDMCVSFQNSGHDAETQVLAPMKASMLGVNNINEKLQNALNPYDPSKPEYRRGETVLRLGDRVMQIKNNYRLEWQKTVMGRVADEGTGVFNGDIGTVMKIDRHRETVSVLFDDERTAEYSSLEIEEIMLAYCISVHKSQGSEFSTIILPLVYGSPMLMNRNILYTAVTRARDRVYIVGTSECVEKMVLNGYTEKRYSALGWFLKQLNDGEL